MDKVTAFEYLKTEIKEKYWSESQMIADSRKEKQNYEEEETYNDYWDLKEDDNITF